MRAEEDPVRAADAALLAAYADGDHSAARRIAADHVPRVLNLARRMLGNESDAEEVAQEAMLRLWKIAPDWREGEARIATWLYRVAANLCTDRLRKVRPGPLDPGHDPADDRPGQDARMIAADRNRALAQAIGRLPERQRLAVILRHLEERTNPEIAEIMDLSVEAVESLVARGKRALAADLAPRRPELGYEGTET